MEKLIITGNLTRDPESRVTQSGINVCTFTVAVNKPLTKSQKDAGQQAQAKFFRVSAWRELGDNCQKYLAKGRKVMVVGTVDVNAYIGNQDGQAHASLEVTANEVEFLTPRNEQEGGQAPAQGYPAPGPAQAPAPQYAPQYGQPPQQYGQAPQYATPPQPQYPQQQQMQYAPPPQAAPAAAPAGFTPVETDDLPF